MIVYCKCSLNRTDNKCGLLTPEGNCESFQTCTSRNIPVCKPDNSITHVAVIHKGILYSLPKPNRHHNVILLIYACTKHSVCEQTEGFLHPDGHFIGRTEAGKLALSTGQIDKMNWGDLLYSEDLW